MKKTWLTGLMCVSLMIICGIPAFAQQKIGYLNSQEILQLMPERDSAAKIFTRYYDELQKQYESMNNEYTNLLEIYSKQRDSLSDTIRQAKEAELQEKMIKIQNFQTGIQQEMENKQIELMTPVEAKLKDAIQQVAKENKFTYIIDVYKIDPYHGSLFYQPKDQSLNVLPLVKSKLGIK